MNIKHIQEQANSMSAHSFFTSLAGKPSIEIHREEQSFVVKKYETMIMSLKIFVFLIGLFLVQVNCGTLKALFVAFRHGNRK